MKKQRLPLTPNLFFRGFGFAHFIVGSLSFVKLFNKFRNKKPSCHYLTSRRYSATRLSVELLHWGPVALRPLITQGLPFRTVA
jgi:hypothetical protein